MEYVYAVLPAWGMHRMGRQRAKVRDFEDIVRGLRANLARIEQLWSLQITRLSPGAAAEAASCAWEIIAAACMRQPHRRARSPAR